MPNDHSGNRTSLLRPLQGPCYLTLYGLRSTTSAARIISWSSPTFDFHTHQVVDLGSKPAAFISLAIGFFLVIERITLNLINILFWRSIDHNAQLILLELKGLDLFLPSRLGIGCFDLGTTHYYRFYLWATEKVCRFCLWATEKVRFARCRSFMTPLLVRRFIAAGGFEPP